MSSAENKDQVNNQVTVDIPILHCVPETRYVRAFRHCSWDDVKYCLSTAPWSAMEVRICSYFVLWYIVSIGSFI